jgi:hypothetical protein
MKDTFDKVIMDESRQEEIRAGLMKKKKAKKTWLAPVAAVAAAIAIIMIVPGTREIIVKAAETIYSTFTSNFNNLNVSIDETSFTGRDGSQIHRVSATYTFDDVEPWGQVKDGRLYFVLDGKWEDITDKCSASEVFRYEKVDENGYKITLFVGGTPDDYGWGQIVRNPKGELIEGFAVIDNVKTEPEWLNDLKKREANKEFMIIVLSKDEYTSVVAGEQTVVFFAQNVDEN